MRGAYPGIGSASFNCPSNASQAEWTICDHQALWPFDRAMARSYFRLRASLPGPQADALRASQRAWLSQRDACGRDEPCLAEAYKQRIAELAYW